MSAALMALLGAAAFAVLIAGLRRSEAAGRERRLHALDLCRDVLDGPSVAADPAGYGVLRGRFRGCDVALRPIHEQLVFRRLPQLWLLATVRLPTGRDATLDIVRRPMGAEFFSLGASLPDGFAPPASWPQDTSVRGAKGARRLLDDLTVPLGAMLADDRVKAVSVTPAGARAIRQIGQGDRGAYLLFRDSRFSGVAITADDALATLELALHAALSARGNGDIHARAA